MFTLDAMMKSYNFKIKVEPDTFHDETPLKHTVVGAKDANWVELCVKYREMIDNKSTPKAESSSPIVEQSDLQENSRSNIPEGNSRIVGKKRSHPGSDKNFPCETTGSNLSRDLRLRQNQ